jgi:organic radical activating enzyme
MNLVRVNEHFYSIQAEGRWAGTPATFFRLSGCNRHCDFCDTNHETIQFHEGPGWFLKIARLSPSKFIVFTGGEPLLQYQALKDVIVLLKENGYTLAVETNGTIRLPETTHKDLEASEIPVRWPHGFDIVTVSPKDLDSWVLRRDYETLKVVYVGQDLKPYEDIMAQYPGHLEEDVGFKEPDMFLQPCWEKDKPLEYQIQIAREVAEVVKERPQWKLSLQVHKILGVL